MTGARGAAVLSWCIGCALWLPTEALAEPRTNVGRWLTTDAAEGLDAPVLGLQRSALPLVAGLAVDTSVYGDALLALNAGLRWSGAVGPHRLVLGARYTHLVGRSVYSSIVTSKEPALERFSPELSGPSFYAVYGVSLGSVLIQGEARYATFDTDYLSLTATAAWNFLGHWSLVAEGGVRIKGGDTPRGALGVRYGGEHLGLGVGLAYVDLSDPALPGKDLPVLPVIDLSWIFR
ncbi:hypothetical protein JGU66_22350 [Myxococcaceae bacterium JPH2]|nr:hypothetical protein [Myxococcaceae bacterium JPH2]